MIIRKRLENLTLKSKPFIHMALASTLVAWDFSIPPKTEVIIENLDRIPQDRAVIFVMNHPNIYNYLPFLFKLIQLHKKNPTGPFPSVAPWAKARFFHHPLAGKFLTAANVIPLPSQGYLLSKDFKNTLKRVPDDAEYRLLRDLSDGQLSLSECLSQADDDLARFVTTPHGEFDPRVQPYDQFIRNLYYDLMGLVVRISQKALLTQKISLLIFPEGTTSLSLRKGQIGVAQMALKTQAPVIPVGANGLDKLYPGLSPFSRGGQALYRIGYPLSIADDLAPFAVTEPFTPFTPMATAKFGDRFRAATDLIMDRLNNLLDPPYQFSPDAPPSELRGARRFV